MRAFRHKTLFGVCIAVLVVVLVPAALRQYSLYEQQRVLAFYYSALSGAGVSVSSAESLRALELKYEVTVAERAPQYALAGTDPDRLEHQVDELARVQKAQADSLRIPSNIEYVRTALYPIAFLRALTAAERARLAFIESPSDVTSLAYRATISSTTEAQRHDSELFGEAYRFLGYKNAKFPLLGGTATSDNIEKAVDAVHASADGQADILSKRNRCFDGAIRACETKDIELPLPPAVQDTRDVQAFKLVTDIRAIYRQSTAESKHSAPSRLVTLSSSTCLASMPGPYTFYHYLMPEDSTDYRQPSLLYFGDILFSTSTAQLTNITKGIVKASINMQSPTVFYECPDNGLDVSRVRTVELAASFAKAHPVIAPAEREKLLSTEILHEEDAAAYLRAALQSGAQYTREEERQLIELALMYRNNSASLDSTVNEVWTLSENNLKLIKAGYPFDDSMLFFFGSHSAFPTFFQIYNPSVVSDAVSIYDRSPEALKAFTGTMLRYSEHPEYRGAIVQFISEYRRFESK